MMTKKTSFYGITDWGAMRLKATDAENYHDVGRRGRTSRDAQKCVAKQLQQMVLLNDWIFHQSATSFTRDHCTTCWKEGLLHVTGDSRAYREGTTPIIVIKRIAATSRSRSLLLVYSLVPLEMGRGRRGQHCPSELPPGEHLNSSAMVRLSFSVL